MSVTGFAALIALPVAVGVWPALRKRAASRQDGARLQALMHTLHDGVAIFGAAGELVAANYAYTRIFPPGSDAPECWPWTLHDDDGELVEPCEWPAAKILRGEALTRRRFRLDKGATAPELVLDVWGGPVKAASGGRRGAVLVVRDVTGLVTMEHDLQEVHELQAIGLVAAGVAHDFNNTLTVVQGNASLIRQRQGIWAAVQEIDGVIAAVRRGAVMTRRLLALTRREPGSGVALHPGTVLTDSAPTLRRLLPSGATLEVSDVSDPSDRVTCDPRSLELALVSLIGTARLAMTNGGTLRLVCDAGEFLDPKTLQTERLVRLTFEGPGRVLGAAAAAQASPLQRRLESLGLANGRRWTVVVETLPCERARVQLLLTSAGAPAAPAPDNTAGRL